MPKINEKEKIAQDKEKLLDDTKNAFESDIPKNLLTFSISNSFFHLGMTQPFVMIIFSIPYYNASSHDNTQLNYLMQNLIQSPKTLN